MALSNISKSGGMMNLFPYESAIALSQAFVASLSQTFILNFMQLGVQLSLEMMPCRITFLFSDFPQVSVACKHIKILYAQYLIPFEFYCQFLYDSSAYVTH